MRLSAHKAGAENNIGLVVDNRLYNLGDFLRIIFQIGILDDDNISCHGSKSRAQCGTFASVHIMMELNEVIAVITR